MFIETGSLVFLSLVVGIFWLPKRTVLWLFGHPVMLELPFGILAYMLHYGTFSGMMAAAVAAVLCAAFTRGGRVVVGYIKSDTYYPGWVRMSI